MFYSNIFSDSPVIFEFSSGAVDVKLTEEEKKELEAPYQAQAAFGHE